MSALLLKSSFRLLSLLSFFFLLKSLKRNRSHQRLRTSSSALNLNSSDISCYRQSVIYRMIMYQLFILRDFNHTFRGRVLSLFSPGQVVITDVLLMIECCINFVNP